MAVDKGYNEVIDFLLENVGDVKKNLVFRLNECNAGFTPLHRAAGTGNNEALLKLLKAGFKPRSTKIGTPLDLAVKSHHVECINILLENGDTSIKNVLENKRTMKSLTKDSGKEEVSKQIVDLLLQYRYAEKMVRTIWLILFMIIMFCISLPPYWPLSDLTYEQRFACIYIHSMHP
jgi:ankyrin repeat protein